MNKQKPLIQKGFTLVELLIVVIILAILAAIVVPQFASSTDDAKDSALDSNLANLRAAIDLYYQQHGKYPSAVAATGGTCVAGGAVGTGAINTDRAFKDQLAFYTNAAGQSCTIQGDDGTPATYFPYGPYLKKDTLPKNTMTDAELLTIVTVGNLQLAGTAAPAVGKGWRFDNKSGKFVADHADYDDR